jgi:hypothetical protein
VIKGTVDNGRAADTVANVDEEEVCFTGRGRLVAERKGTDFMDELDRCIDHGAQGGFEVEAFRPVKIGRKKDAAKLFIEETGDADKHAPDFGGFEIINGVSNSFLPLPCRAGGGNVGGPAGILGDTKRGVGEAGAIDAKLNQEKPGGAGVEAESLTRPAGAVAFSTELSEFKYTLFQEFVDDFSSRDAAGAGDFGQFSAGRGGDLNHVTENETAIGSPEA